MAIVCYNYLEVRDELSATEYESMLLNKKCIQNGRDLSLPEENLSLMEKEMTDEEMSTILK